MAGTAEGTVTETAAIMVSMTVEVTMTGTAETMTIVAEAATSRSLISMSWQ